MTVESGQYGNATMVTDVDTGTITTADTLPTGFANVIHLTKWTMDRDVVEGQYASNLTKGNYRRTTGTRNCKGTIATVMDMLVANMTQLAIGARVRLRLYTAPLIGHELSVKILSKSYEVDVENGNEVRPVYNWGADDNDPYYEVALPAQPTLPTAPTLGT